MDDLRFSSFSKVFQLYQDDGCVIMKDCVQLMKLHLWLERSPLRSGLDVWMDDLRFYILFNNILRPFQQYFNHIREDWQMIIKDCVQWMSIYG